MGKKQGQKKKQVDPSLVGFKFSETKQRNFDRQEKPVRSAQSIRSASAEEIFAILDGFTREKTVVCDKCNKKQKFDANNIEMLRKGCEYARLQMNSNPKVPAWTINCQCVSSQLQF